MSASNARLGLGLVGAAIGGYFGGPSGANSGFLIGSTIGGFIFPDPPVVTDGPRLGDLNISGSQYGTPIPLGYGTVRMGGNLIWSSGIREVSTEQDVSQEGGPGGKGAKGPTQVLIVYTYFVDIAIGFSEGVAEAILRLWFDNELVYDNRGLGRLARPQGAFFRFYPGNETQLPDPTMEAAIGADLVPAHRGMCYLVFPNLEVTETGNRIPAIQAEIAYNSQSEDTARYNTGAPLVSTSHQNTNLASDRHRRVMYFIGTAPGPIKYLRVVNYDNDLVDFVEKPDTEIFVTDESLPASTGMCTDTDGFIYLNASDSNRRPIVKVDPTSLQEVNRFGFAAISSEEHLSFRNMVGCMVIELLNPAIQILNPIGPIEDPHVMGTFKFLVSFNGAGGNDLGIVDLRHGDMFHLYNDTSSNFFNVKGMVPVPAELQPQQGVGIGYFATQNGGNNDISLYRVNIQSTASWDEDVGTTGVEVELAANIPASTWNNDGASSPEVVGPILDETDLGLIFIKAADSFVGSYIFKWLDGAIVWVQTTAVQQPTSGGSIADSVIDNGVFAFSSTAERAVMINTTDGSVIIENLDLDTLIDPDPINAQPQFYDSETKSIIVMQSHASTPIAQFFLDRISGLGELLSDIVTDISSHVRLTPDDIDVTELTETVRGYAVTRPMPARAAIGPLSVAFFFDGVESDGKIVFKKRGRESTLSITDQNMMAVKDTGDVIGEFRTQEVELPERVGVTYSDIDLDYQRGTSSVKRVRNPAPTMRSDNDEGMEFPIVFNASEAEQLAERLLFTSWNERTLYQFLLPWDYLVLDPADVINLAITRNGTTVNIRGRVTKITVNLDMSMSVEALNEDKITIESDASAISTLGFEVQTVNGPAVTELFLFDIPLLLDQDESGVLAFKTYYAMDGLRDGWTGGALYNSVDSLIWNSTGLKSLVPVTHGTVANLIPDTTTPFLTDETTVINVFLAEGTLSSITQSQFLNDGNTALIGNRENQTYELISFRDAVLLSNGSYNLTGLMRGRRGTEVWTGLHATGDKFIYVATPQIQAFPEQLSSIGVQEFYRAVGFGQVVTDAKITGFRAVGRSKMPYAVAHIDAVVDGGSNIDISWVRRTRVGGQWLSLNNQVALSEDTEAYEIDIKEFDDVFSVNQVLLPFDGADADTFTTDLAPPALPWTFEAAAELDTAQSKFGGSSLFLDGIDGTAIFTPDNDEFDIGTSDFTFECHVRYSALSATVQRVLSRWDATFRLQFTFGINAANELGFGWSTDGSNFFFKNETWGPSIDTWYHIAVSRNGNDLRSFVDGVQLGSPTDVTGVSIFNPVDGITIGAEGGGNNSIRVQDGWIDNVRVKIGAGAGIYTANFTPPVQPFVTATTGSVRRTLTSTQELVQYDSADILADFPVLPTTFNFTVYQMSAQIGRGFGVAQSITF